MNRAAPFIIIIIRFSSTC